MAASWLSGNLGSSSRSSLNKVEQIHQVDIVGDISPVKVDVVEELLGGYVLDFVVFLLKEAPVHADRVNHLCHFKKYLKSNQMLLIKSIYKTFAIGVKKLIFMIIAQKYKLCGCPSQLLCTWMIVLSFLQNFQEYEHANVAKPV